MVKLHQYRTPTTLTPIDSRRKGSCSRQNTARLPGTKDPDGLRHATNIPTLISYRTVGVSAAGTSSGLPVSHDAPRPRGRGRVIKSPFWSSLTPVHDAT